MTWTTLAGINLFCMVAGYSFLAYAIARLCWNGRGIVLVLLAIIICTQAWLVPQLVATFAFGLPRVRYWIWFGDWLVTAFGSVWLWCALKETSGERADAARLDGAGAISIYWHIILPLVRPILFLLAFFTLMGMAPDLLARAIENLHADSIYIITGFFSMVVASAVMAIPTAAIFFIAKKIFPPTGRSGYR